MIRSATSLAVLALCLTSFAATSAQAENAQQQCDRLAASPNDPTLPAGIVGIDTGVIETEAAISACKAAIATENKPRYHYQLGRAYFDREDFDLAFQEFKIGADAGLAVSQGALGYLYGEGLGVAMDKQVELELTRKAAEGGVAFAAHNLGVILRDGVGITADYKESFAWFSKAVDMGYTQSIVDIGFAYDEGKGVDVDYAEAKRWYLKAAEEGIVEAYNNLGTLYEDGRGVNKDYVVALEWYAKAQAKGYTLADVNIAHLTDAGLGTKAAPEKAADLVLKAFENGGASDDAFNRSYIDEEVWTPAFWTAFQKRLTTAKGYTGPVDGTLNPQTKAAMDALMDK